MAGRSEEEGSRIPERRRRRRKRRRPTEATGGELVAAAAGEPIPAAAGAAGAELATGAAEDRPGLDDGRLTPELAALLEEGQTAAPAGDGNPPPSPAAQGSLELDRDTFTRIVAGGVRSLARPACRWLNVTALEDSEVADLTTAVYELAAAYDVLAHLDPKTAAACNAGLVSAGIVMNRQRLAAPPAPSSAELERQVHSDNAAASSTTPPRPPSPAALSTDLNTGFDK